MRRSRDRNVPPAAYIFGSGGGGGAVVSAEACAASRAMMDAHLGPPAKDVNVLGDRAAAAAAAGGVWGATPWPSFLACGPGHDHMPTCTGFDGLQCPM